MKIYDSSEYRATVDWPYSISAGCIVYRLVDGVPEVMLLKREVGHSHNPQDIAIYSAPKGHNEFDETLIQTALRETEEESGSVATIETYLGSTLRSFYHPVYNVPIDKATHYFAGLWQKDTNQMDGEHDGKLWLTPEEAIRLLEETSTPRGEAEMVRRLLKFLELTNAS